MTKLFVITCERGSIVGLTEKRKTAKRFSLERSKLNTVIHETKDIKVINKIWTELRDLNIEEEPLLGILLTERESSQYMKEINAEYDRIRSTYRDMNHMYNKYMMDEHIENDIVKGIRGLTTLLNPKVFGRTFGIELVIQKLTFNYEPLSRYLDEEK